MEGTFLDPRSVKPMQVEQSSSTAIMELRRRSGLTWELISELFNVSRHTVQNWANGGAPSALHEREICNSLNVIRHIDNGIQRDTHNRILSTDHGVSIFDLLIHRRYEELLRLETRLTTVNAAHEWASLSQDEWDRRPTRPELLLSAIQDRPVSSQSKARLVRPMRKHGQEND